METYANLDDLFDRLRKPRLNLKIGILYIGSEKELDRLLSIRELLADMRLVVVLPIKTPRQLPKPTHSHRVLSPLPTPASSPWYRSSARWWDAGRLG